MQDEAYAPTARTTPSRNAGRVSYDREAVHAVLDEGFVCHVGVVADGLPLVLPYLYARWDERLYLHGSTGAAAMLAARGDGLDVCVTVTLLDGLVLARSAFHHSTNYRTVVARGRATVVLDEAEKRASLDRLVDAVVAGRSAHSRAADARELAATTVLRLPLQEVSLKQRSGGPDDDAADLALGHWAGVLPLALVPQLPVPADGVDGPVPEHVSAWRR